MKNLVILSDNAREIMPDNSSIETITIETVPVVFGLLETRGSDFDPRSLENKHRVLVKKKAFSCNYRDIAMILAFNAKFENAKKDNKLAYSYFGSEFCGEVIDVGPEVKTLKPGDRVIGDNSYPFIDVNDALPGIPSNAASKAYDIFHYAKLAKIPSNMPDDVAAAFSIGGQTVYGMIRRLNIQEGNNVLITAAKSNTSMFAINALRKSKAIVYALSTSGKFEDKLRELGVRQIFQIDPHAESLLSNPDINEAFKKTGGFHQVIDPFMDLYFKKSMEVLRDFGSYISCGIYDQFSNFTGKTPHKGPDWQTGLIAGFLKNLNILGNCLGLSQDLQQAIDDYASGSLNVIIDSMHSGNQAGNFIERTYNAKDRFGKVVYKYD